MRIAMVLPTYWTRKRGEIRKHELVYDHPTPLDSKSTLKRAIESTGILIDRGFDVIVIGCATSRDIEDAVEGKIQRILTRTKWPVRVKFLSYSHLRRLIGIARNEGLDKFTSMLSLRGYSNIRNMSFIVCHILGYDTIVSIDDDELFTKPGFIQTVKKSLTCVDGLAGFYTHDDDYLIPAKYNPWEKHMNKIANMNNTLTYHMRSKNVLSKTFFVLGGNLVIAKRLFMKVPFDPKITRGEDMDYAVNARILGEDMYFHNKLGIEHKPPNKREPYWLMLRKEFMRFNYERQKAGNIKMDYGHYPGVFLKDDNIELFRESNRLLLEHYRGIGNLIGIREAMKNKRLMQEVQDEPSKVIREFKRFAGQWKELMRIIEKKRTRFAPLLESIKEF